MTPLFVRSPSIQSMDTEVFLYPIILSEQHLLMQSVKNEYNHSTNGFPRTNLLFNKQETIIHQGDVYNGDFSTKRAIDMSMKSIITDEVGFMQNIESYELVEAYKNGELKGKLKEIAAGLDEEDNPVIMFAKHKK